MIKSDLGYLFWEIFRSSQELEVDDKQSQSYKKTGFMTAKSSSQSNYPILSVSLLLTSHTI